MYPFLQKGDTLILDPNSKVKNGDVIVFIGEPFIKVHRALICLPGGRVLQKADRYQVGSWIRSNEVVAKVKSFRRDNKEYRIDTFYNRIKGLIQGYAVLLKYGLKRGFLLLLSNLP